MKIRGMEHLRKNDYNKLVIRKGRVNVYSESLIPTMKMSHSIEDELRTLDDVAKVERIIDYYLDYNPVNSIDENYNRVGRSIFITSTTGSELRLGRRPYGDFLEKIFNKYRETRWQTACLNPIGSFEFKTSYNYTGFFKNDDGIDFVLSTKFGELLPQELDFFEMVLPVLFGDSEVRIKKRFKPNSYTGIASLDLDGYYVIGEDSTIKVDRKLLPLTSKIVSKHNKQVKKLKEENEKIYQMTWRI